MTVKEIVAALSNVLKVNFPSNKKSFRELMLFLLDKKSGSEIINAAYKIKNIENNIIEKSHWPLLDK